jgi:hypothetical protein
MVTKNYIFLVAFVLSACSGADRPTTFDPIPAAKAGDSELMYVFESVIEIVWDNGIQTSHYMHGPGTTAFVPNSDWHYVLRGATSNSIDFFLPVAHVRKAVWRTVWLPQHSEARLLYAFHGGGVTCPCERIVAAEVIPLESEHPLANPRATDVDITDAVNTAFSTAVAPGESVQFMWEVKSTIQ